MHEAGYCHGVLHAVEDRASGRPVARIGVRVICETSDACRGLPAGPTRGYLGPSSFLFRSFSNTVRRSVRNAPEPLRPMKNRTLFR